MPIKVGDTLPSVEVQEEAPNKTVNVKELFAGKKGILFGVPGAFTPGCTKTHLPGYVADYEQLKAKGVQVVACLTVNDAFVTAAWGESCGTGGKVRMLADATAAYTKAIDMELDATHILGNIRCKRFSMLVEDSVVVAMNVEPDGTGLTCTLSNALLDQL
jgi:2-Cys peroxiredoxin 5